MAIVRLRMSERDTKINELLGMFNLPHVAYSKGYQAKSSVIGGSASTTAPNTEALRLKAVNELLKWSRAK